MFLRFHKQLPRLRNILPLGKTLQVSPPANNSLFWLLQNKCVETALIEQTLLVSSDFVFGRIDTVHDFYGSPT
jgi:hypothetical protein